MYNIVLGYEAPSQISRFVSDIFGDSVATELTMLRPGNIVPPPSELGYRPLVKKRIVG